MNPTAQPFVKWVGGKRQLLPHLLPRVPATFGRYYEPFVGGGALFFALHPECATIADANERLVRTYRGVRDNVEAVIARLLPCPYERQFYMDARAADVDRFATDDAVAAWFIYLNRASWNGVYRVNSKGQFNVPFGTYANPTICDAANLRACSAALRDTSINRCDFAEAVVLADPGDFVYFDPPYVPASATSAFTSYTADGFGAADQARLRDYAVGLRRRGVYVLLSNSDTPMVRDLYRGWDIVRVERRGTVSCKATAREAVGEVVIGHDWRTDMAEGQGVLL